MRDIAMVCLFSNLDRFYTQCNVSSIYFEQTFVCGVLGEIFRRNKKVSTECKSENIPEADSAPRNRSFKGAPC